MGKNGKRMTWGWSPRECSIVWKILNENHQAALKPFSLEPFFKTIINIKPLLNHYSNHYLNHYLNHHSNHYLTILQPRSLNTLKLLLNLYLNHIFKNHRTQKLTEKWTWDTKSSETSDCMTLHLNDRLYSSYGFAWDEKLHIEKLTAWEINL